MTWLVAASAFLAVIWSIWQLRSKPSRAKGATGLAALICYVALMHFAFGFPAQSAELAKGGETESNILPLVVALYLFMVLGMAAEYLYHFLDSKAGESKFGWRAFVKPFVVSPLVFVPLAASLQNAKVDLTHFDIPLLMLFLVAFENGFLWRGYFTRKLSSSAPEKADSARAA